MLTQGVAQERLLELPGRGRQIAERLVAAEGDVRAIADSPGSVVLGPGPIVSDLDLVDACRDPARRERVDAVTVEPTVNPFAPDFILADWV